MRHELVHLFPRLSVGGILIIDDYGHWIGARAATDEYFQQNRVRMLLQRVDYTARVDGCQAGALSARPSQTAMLAARP
jgi:O-methyltransferase